MTRWIARCCWLVMVVSLGAAEGPNLITNFSFENSDSTGQNPSGWGRGRWGTNSVNFIYPATPAFVGSRAVGIQMTSRSTGDAKWYPTEVSVTPGQQYHFFDRYMATTQTWVTLQYRMTDGSFTWQDVATPPASSSYVLTAAIFTVPQNAVGLTIFHLINQVGTLTMDDFELHLMGTSLGVVSLNFDDGFKENISTAMPIVDAAGLKTTQYIITGRFSFPAYDNANEVLTMASHGHEIGAHTRTHCDLTTSGCDAPNEIAGSKADLQALGLNPTTLAYPFGAYDANAISLVQQAGFAGARSTDDGDVVHSPGNTKTTNRFTLVRMGMVNTTQLADVEAAIDAAVLKQQWLILVFHHVNNADDGAPYVVTTSFLQNVVNYLVSKKVPVVTTAQGLQLMSN
jgi:peptidoglycan/xylan/chitin deacetylase (PgdA/CDA1 family)